MTLGGNQHSTAGVDHRHVGADHAVRRHQPHASSACASIRRSIRRRSRSRRLSRRSRRSGAGADHRAARRGDELRRGHRRRSPPTAAKARARSRPSFRWTRTSTPRPATCATSWRAPCAICRRTSNPPILNKANADSTPIFGLALSSEHAHAARARCLCGHVARAAADRARHCLGRSAGGEALCDAPVDGSGEARRLQPLAARRARRPRAREHRAAFGPHRRRGRSSCRSRRCRGSTRRRSSTP